MSARRCSLALTQQNKPLASVRNLGLNQLLGAGVLSRAWHKRTLLMKRKNYFET